MSFNFDDGFLPTPILDDAQLPASIMGDGLAPRNLTGLSLQSLCKAYWLAKSFDWVCDMDFGDQGTRVGSGTVSVTDQIGLPIPPPSRMKAPGFTVASSPFCGPIPLVFLGLPAGFIGPVLWFDFFYGSPSSYYNEFPGGAGAYVSKTGNNYSTRFSIFDGGGFPFPYSLAIPQTPSTPIQTDLFVSVQVGAEASSPAYFYSASSILGSGSLAFNFNNFWSLNSSGIWV